MDDRMIKVCSVAALLAFAFCFAAGLWILTKTGLDHGDGTLTTAIGLYFIGKAFFVGPMLLAAVLSQKTRDRRPTPAP